jgi:hypothetical protein
VIDDARWREIEAAALPHQPDAQARNALDAVLTVYPGLLRNPAAIRQERDRWRRILDAIEGLTPELVEYLGRDPEPRLLDLARGPDDGPVLRLLQALWKFDDRAIARLAALEQWCLHYQRTSDPARDVWLYEGLLEIWTKHFGGNLGYSTSAKGERTGPLIRFLQTTTALVLDPPSKPRMLRYAIKREVERRAVQSTLLKNR